MPFDPHGPAPSPPLRSRRQWRRLGDDGGVLAGGRASRGRGVLLFLGSAQVRGRGGRGPGGRAGAALPLGPAQRAGGVAAGRGPLRPWGPDLPFPAGASVVPCGSRAPLAPGPRAPAGRICPCHRRARPCRAGHLPFGPRWWERAASGRLRGMLWGRRRQMPGAGRKPQATRRKKVHRVSVLRSQLG